MLYLLLAHLNDEHIIFNLLRYLTFRTGAALMTALLICWLIGPSFIRWLRSMQGDGQPIRSDGPETHFKKKGTPTMGGLLMLIALFISTLLWADLSSPYIWIVLLVMAGFGLVGFADDFAKLRARNHAGVSGRVRLLWQFLIAGCAALLLTQVANPEHATALAFPIFKDWLWQMGYFYIAFAAVVMVSAGNAMNLTDGLDGLATVPMIFCAASFGLIAYLAGNAVFANYLQITHVPGTGELAVLCGALIGAGLGFLWYNAPPAQIFMGDTGSLALGGGIGAIAVASKHELVLPVIGGLFVAETVSVMLQVGYFKLTGKRIFKMAPLHHHFEKLGWPESTIVVRFWIISAVLALIGLSSLKLR